MKKILTLALVAMLLLCAAAASADELGIQIIGGPGVNAEPVSLENFKLEHVYKVDGFAWIQGMEFKYQDDFLQYKKDMAGDNSTARDANGGQVWSYNSGVSYYYNNIDRKSTGVNAEFAMLYIDITNRMMSPVDFTKDVTVKVIYDEVYEYAGWVRQFNYDYDAWDGNKNLIRAAIAPENTQEIDMIYTGHYVFGCTLPNVAVEDSAPLTMVINLGGNEITYHIRK